MNPKIMGGGMKVGRCEKESFVVIGKEGTTTDGDDLFNDYGLTRMRISMRFSR